MRGLPFGCGPSAEGGGVMSRETKMFCDRCGKDITNQWRGILFLPKRIKMQNIRDDGRMLWEFKFDLCKQCEETIYRILEGKE